MSRAASLALSIVLIAAAFPVPVGAQGRVAVTVSVTGAPLPAVLQAVARAAGAGIVVDATVPDTRATVHFRNTPLHAAWALLERAYGLLIREISPGNYVASAATAAAARAVARPEGWEGGLVRAFALRHARAEDVATSLTALFGFASPAQQAAPGGTDNPSSRGQDRSTAPPQAPGTQAVFPASPAPPPQDGQQQARPPGAQPQAVQVAVAAVPDANMLLVRAPAHVMLMIASAIRQIEQSASQKPPAPPAAARKPAGPTTEPYVLRYAKASAVAKVISDKVSGVKIHADDATNTLFVTAHPADHERIRSILELVDRPTPQILVEAEVFSVQGSAERILGIEWTLDAVYTISLDPAKLDPFKVIARLQAAAREGKADVISKPRVLTVSGEQASITVGDQIPIVGRDREGNPVVVTTANAGMRLQVTPRVMPEGVVELVLSAEANTLSGFVGDFPIISQRAVQTRLLVRDGMPVIIGGIIGENRSTTTTKFPILGDLPILGALFRTTTTRVDRVELVIVVTPRIVSPGPIVSPGR